MALDAVRAGSQRVYCLPILFWLMRGSLSTAQRIRIVPTNESWYDECEPSQPSDNETGAEHVRVDADEPQELPENWMGPIDAIAVV